jgi:hypothetical protein
VAEGSEFNYHASQAISRTSAVLAVLFLGERFHLYHVIGIAPIVGVIVLASLRLRPAQEGMTVFRVSLIVPLLLLTAATPEVPARSPAPELPPTVMLQTFSPREAMSVLGHPVVEADGQTVARLIDVLVDPKGQPVAAVLDFGGFMGVGSRKTSSRRRPSTGTRRSRRQWSCRWFREPGRDSNSRCRASARPRPVPPSAWIC